VEDGAQLIAGPDKIFTGWWSSLLSQNLQIQVTPRWGFARTKDWQFWSSFDQEMGKHLQGISSNGKSLVTELSLEVKGVVWQRLWELGDNDKYEPNFDFPLPATIENCKLSDVIVKFSEVNENKFLVLSLYSDVQKGQFEIRIPKILRISVWDISAKSEFATEVMSLAGNNFFGKAPFLLPFVITPDLKDVVTIDENLDVEIISMSIE
jgi:hypothetical protein